MKRLPIGIQDFRQLITESFLYIDKTKQIHRLITEQKFCFISRPRRFGKSLLVSTLQEIFLGNKELFEGTWIFDKEEYDWKYHPVINLDMSNITREKIEDFKNSLSSELDTIAARYGINLIGININEDKLKILASKLSEKGSIVILIDEYDHPILKHINNVPLALQMREILKNFYTTIKSLTKYCRFILVTGVSKFSQTSIFSGLNMLDDLSTLSGHPFGDLLGYTEEEINIFLKQHLEAFAQKNQLDYQTAFNNLRTWYNGYRFTIESSKVYNPFSILKALQRGEIKNYWFQTGTPSFLVKLLKETNRPIETFQNVAISDNEMAAFDIPQIPIKTLLFQTGYLTVKSWDKEYELYQLDFPNREVDLSFNFLLLHAFSKLDDSIIHPYLVKLKRSLYEDRVADFLNLLYEFYAEIPYDLHMDFEKYYQTIFYCFCKVLDMQVDSEIRTNQGRIDIALTTPTHYYLIELKKDGSGQAALDQILKNKYYEKYMNTGRKVTLIGIAFDSNTRNINPDFQIKEVRKEK